MFRAIGVVALLGAINVAYFWQNKEAFERLIPRNASLDGSPQRAFGQAPKEVCQSHPADLIADLESMVVIDENLSKRGALGEALARFAVADTEIKELETALSKVIDPKLLPGQARPYRLRLDRKRRIAGFELEYDAGHLIQVCKEKQRFVARNVQYTHSTQVEAVSLSLGADARLVSAVREQKEHASLARRLAEVFVHEFDPQHDLRPGDRVQLLVEKQRLGDRFHRYGRILAFAFSGQAGRFSYYYRAVSPGVFAYYDQAGRPLRRNYIKNPTAWYAGGEGVGSGQKPEQMVFDRRRGAEYRRPEGLPVIAVSDFEVRRSGEDPKLGLFVEGRDRMGRVQRYASLGALRPSLKKGAKVAQGEVVGFVGRTGVSARSTLRLECTDTSDKWIYFPEFVGVAGESGPVLRVGQRLSPQALAAHRRAIRPWIKSLVEAQRNS